MEYLKAKLMSLKLEKRNIRDLYRGINEFKKGYISKIKIIKDENGKVPADHQGVFNRWKNSFNQVQNVRQMDVHTAEPLMPEPSLV
jgi:hypothetical protein